MSQEGMGGQEGGGAAGPALVAGVDYVTPAAALSTYVVAAGKAGGQTVIGGTGAGENLILQSTSHATRGKVYLGSALTVWSDGVAGNARFNVDTTGLATTVPVKVLNGMSLSGIELQVTGTVATGFILRDSAGVQKGVLGYAVAAADWATGAVAGGLALVSVGGMRIVTGSGDSMFLSAGNSALIMSTAGGAQLSYGGGTLTVGAKVTVGAIPFVITSTTSLSDVALQIAGDPNTGFGAIGGADSLSVVCGGVERARWSTTFKVFNGVSLGGVEAQVTGTAATGFVLRDSAGTQKAVLGYAVSTNDWLSGTIAGNVVLSVANGLFMDAPAASGITLRGAALGVLSLNSSSGAVLNYNSLGLSIAGTAVFNCPLAISNSTSLSAVALQIAGDPNTGNGAPGGADTYDMIAGGVSAVRAVADAATADTETNFLVRRNVGAAFTLQRVSMGAADSGAAGFKLLRVPN